MSATPDGGSSKTPAGKEDSRSKRGWVKRPAVWVGTLATAVIAGVLVNLVWEGVSHAGSHGAAPSIEVDSVTAQYVSRTRIPARPVTLDFEIRNTGNQLAIIKAARVTVQQFAALPVCYEAGDLESTGTYHGFLPEKQPSGQSVNITTHQTIAPDAADRFDITLGLPPGNPYDQNIYVYRIHIGLLYDNSSVPADAGEAVIALPIPPFNEYFWTKQNAADPTRISIVDSSDVPRVRSCLINNSRKLQSILAMRGAMPAELSAVQPQLST